MKDLAKALALFLGVIATGAGAGLGACLLIWGADTTPIDAAVMGACGTTVVLMLASHALGPD